jgi:hypothetical protein
MLVKILKLESAWNNIWRPERENVNLGRHRFLEKVNVRNGILVIFEVLNMVTIKSSVLWDTESCDLIELTGVSEKHTTFIFRFEQQTQ